jgi:hypothetical protein
MVPRIYMTESIEEFLQRPYIVKNTLWSSTDETGDLILGATFPQDLLALNPIWDKVKNFHFLRAGVRLGIRLNGTKFHYGKLIAIWSPQNARTGNLFERTSNIYSVSGFPHVILSPTENEVNEFVVPFTSPYMFSNLAFGLDSLNFGSVFIYVLNPLRNAATVADVGVTLFANFVDPMLQGMTSQIFGQPSPSAALLPLKNPNPYSSDSGDPSTFNAQGKVDVEAEEKSSKGILSTTSMAVSRAAGALIPIPIIGNYAEMISRVASAVGAGAKILGLCKPNSLETVKPVVNRLYTLANSEGLDTSMKLGISPDNAVSAAYDSMGSHEKEMEMSHLFSTPSIRQLAQWQQSDSAGSILISTKVSPTEFHTEIAPPNTVYNPTVLGYATMPFGYWRGSLRYCLQVTCSCFHSGRLRIFWDPGDNPSVNIVDGASHVNHVLDIQHETEYYFSIPYLSPFYWLPRGQENGTLKIQVINELTHAETPVPEVYLNLWVSGGPDYQVARPDTGDLYVGAAATLLAQGITQEEMRNAEYPSLIPCTGVLDNGFLMGEQILHLKQVLMRYCTTGDNQIAANESVEITGHSPLITTTSSVTQPFMYWYKGIYRFSRGSYNIKVNLIDEDEFFDTFYAYLNERSSIDNTNLVLYIDVAEKREQTLNGLGRGALIAKEPVSNAVEVNVPFFSRYTFYISSLDAPNASFTYPSTIYAPFPRNDNPPNAPCRVVSYISAGDDYTMGFITGAPYITRPL